MARLSLYRKWRPQTFSEVVGQDHVTKTLTNALEQNRLSHVYLFAGSRGTGKTSVAKILARAVNCEQGPTPTPCNECAACRGVSQGKLMDVLEIDAASNRGIDEIRDLREKTYFAPTTCRYKVYIIDEVHMLTTEAFNALLKMLEEPPPHTLFILATTEPHKVPLTVLSRCQRFDFQPVLVPDTQKRLEEIAQAEKISLEKGAATFIAQYAQGSLRDAVGILDQIAAFTGGKVGTDDITGLLGIIESELFLEISDIVAKKDAAGAFLFVQKLMDQGKDLRQFLKGLLEHVRNLYAVKTGPDGEKIIAALPDTVARIKKQAPLFEPRELVNFLEILSESYQRARVAPEARFVLETTLVSLIRNDPSEQSLRARVENLEQRLETLMAGTTESRKSSERKPEQDHPAKKAPAVPPRRSYLRVATRSNEAEAAPRPKGGRGDDHETAASPKPQRAAGESQAAVERQTVSAPAKGGSKEVSFERIKRAWPVILNRVKKEKISTYALLLECQPEKVEGATVVLGFSPEAEFHKEEMRKTSNQALLHSVAQEVLGQQVKIECRLKTETQAEQTEAESAKETSSDESRHLTAPKVAELVKNMFEAEIIEEKNL